MAEFASKGVAGSGLGLGIAGTALGVLNGGLGNILGGWNNGCGCSENMAVNRYELGQENRIAKLESEIALRDANIYNDQKMLKTALEYKKPNKFVSWLRAIKNFVTGDKIHN